MSKAEEIEIRKSGPDHSYLNRAIYDGLKWNQFDTELRDLVYSCTTCGKCIATGKHGSRALPLVKIFNGPRSFALRRR